MRALKAIGAILADLALLLLVLWVAVYVTIEPAIHPERRTIEERLAVIPREGLPLDRPVTIRWNAHQVPFVEAETDHDAMFALGLVHGHLRLAQIRILKQISQGRLSEMAGPLAWEVDYALRVLDYGRAAAEIVKRLPPDTRAMLDAFVDGLNYYQEHVQALPPEFALLGLSREPFTAEDLVTIGRLAGTDINWLIGGSLLSARSRADWSRIWQRTLESGSGGTVSFRSRESTGLLERILFGSVISGSNAVVVAPEKSASGGALIAGDPHLGISIPNLWLLAGFRSPSFTAAGLMIPGLPFVAEGRSPDLAWAGTNMRALVSDLYDIAHVKDAMIETYETEIGTRFWFGNSRTVRRSAYGPIVSDTRFVRAQPGETLALRWVGHMPTGEIGDLFDVMRAKDANAFRAALAGFAVSSQNFLCADAKGNICHVLATVLPKRANMPPDSPVLDAANPANEWRELLDARTLPYALNPPEGFLASANNKPTETPYPIGRFFASEERIRRLQQILGADEKISLDDLKALQRDTLSLDARALSEELVRLIESVSGARAAAPAFLAELKGFDGDYRAEARGPVVFETLLYRLVPAVYGESEETLPGAYDNLDQLARHLIADIAALPADKRDAIVEAAVRAAAEDSAQFPAWGDMHRLRIGHWLANVPLIGRFFEYGDYPLGGSRDTVMKTAHGLVNGAHGTSYGSQARFLADMSDPDAAYALLLGGNDGWLGSDNALDEIEMWQKGEYIHLPLRPESVAKEFPLVTILSPGR